MKWLIRIALFFSLALNTYFIIDEVRFTRMQEEEKIMNQTIHGQLIKRTWKEGFTLFTNKLKKNYRSLPAKKYYYINVWTSWCKPCIKEMPWLDSLAGKLDKDVGYFFVTDLSEDAAVKCIRKTNHTIKNFVFLNDMDDFVSAICKEKGTKSRIYPMVLILNNKGELLHSSIGAYENARKAVEFKDLINRLE